MDAQMDGVPNVVHIVGIARKNAGCRRNGLF
jgi:hypothetical protein